MDKINRLEIKKLVNTVTKCLPVLTNGNKYIVFKIKLTEDCIEYEYFNNPVDTFVGVLCTIKQPIEVFFNEDLYHALSINDYKPIWTLELCELYNNYKDLQKKKAKVSKNIVENRRSVERFLNEHYRNL